MPFHMKRLSAGLLLLAWVPLTAETRIKQEIETGLQGVSINNHEAKFEEYKDVPNGVVIERYHMDVDAPNYDMSLEANKLTQEDQSAFLDYDRKGKLWFGAGWDQTPHRWANQSRTLYNEMSPGFHTLPDAVQSYFQTNAGTQTWWNTMPSYAEASHTEKLEVRADKAMLNLGGALTNRTTLNLGFSQEKKNGHQMAPFALGRSYAIELAKTVDQTVYDSSLALAYQGKGSSFGFNYGLNLYENDVQTLIWDNSKRFADRFTNSNTQNTNGDASAAGRASLQPDNLAHNARANAALDLPAKTRFTAEISYTQMKQDEELVPYTINTAMNASTSTVGFNAFDAAELPSKTADTLQNLWTQDYSLANRLWRNLSLGVKARSEQLGNSSKEITFRGHTVLDQGWSSTPETTERFTYRKLGFGAYADWNVFRALSLGLDADQETAHRTHREFDETEEMTYTARADYRHKDWVQARARYLNAHREAKGFEADDFYNPAGTNVAENPGIRRYDIAARVRNAGDLQVQTWRGAFNLGLNGGLGHDKYKPGDGQLFSPFVAVSTSNQNQQYGLLESRVARAGFDLSWDLSETLGLYTFYQYEQVRNLQRQNDNSGGTVAQDASGDYTTRTTDRYDSLGLGVDVALTPKTLVKLAYDLAYSRGAMDYEALGASVASKKSLPETISSKQDYSLRGELKATQNVTLAVGYLFEIYDVKDFATDNVPLVGGQAENQTNVLLGDSSLDYRAHVVNLMARYKF